MARQKAKVGDVVAIPAGDGRTIAAKLLFLSERNRDVALFALTGVEVGPGKAAEISWNDFKLFLYSSVISTTRGDWPVVGHIPLSEQEAAASKRVVAGEVWVADKALGPASASDLAELPQMDVLGAKLVERRAQRLLES